MLIQSAKGLKKKKTDIPKKRENSACHQPLAFSCNTTPSLGLQPGRLTDFRLVGLNNHVNIFPKINLSISVSVLSLYIHMYTNKDRQTDTHTPY